MEKVTEQEQTLEVFENDIQLYLSIFCEENGIKDMKKESQSVWNAALMYIKKHVFSVPDILKDKTPLNHYYNNDYDNKYSNLNNSNCNRYNMNIVNSVCDYYIYLCMLYVKEVSIIGFSNLTGIYTQTIHQWGNDERKLSTSGLDLYKKITEFNEESLSNILISGTRPPVGPIAALNRRHGWASPYAADSNRQKQALTDTELPRLGTSETVQGIQKIEIGTKENQYIVADD